MRLPIKYLALTLCFILSFSLPLVALANDNRDDPDAAQSNYLEEIEELLTEISDLEEEINEIEEEKEQYEEQLEELEADYDAAEEEYEEAVDNNDTELAAEKQSLMEELDEDIEELKEVIEEYEEDLENLEEQVEELEEQIEELEEDKNEDENTEDEDENDNDKEIKPWEQLKNDIEEQKDKAEAEKDYAEKQLEHYKKLYESTGKDQYLEKMEYWAEQRANWFEKMREYKASMKEVIKGKYTEEEWDNLQKLSRTLQAKGFRTLPVNNVFVKNANVKFDTPPVIKDGRLLIPLRALSSATGANVKWNKETKTISIAKGNIVIELEIGDDTIFVNGEESEIDVPAQLVNNRTVVPVRFIVQNLNLNVDWDNQDSTVEIY